jgi:C4-dicarboxylate-binding protein DctP
LVPRSRNDIAERNHPQESTVKTRLLYLALASLLTLPLDAEAQQVNLRATIQVAISDPFMGVSLARFKEEVEKQKDKTISVEIFEKGKLFIDDEVVDAVSSGAIEMGVAGLYQFAKKIPALDIMEQPFLFNFDALVRAAVSPDSEVRGMIDNAIRENLGIRVLWWQSLGNQIFVSKGRNVAEPHQIKGQRIRVFGETTAQLTRYCGGTPAILSAFKMHDALKGNEIDMVICAISAVTNRELWKVADTITRTWHAPIEYLAFINENTWQTLSSSQKTLVLEAARKAEREVREKVTEVEAKYYDFALGKGMKLHELTPDQVADWRACSAEVIDAYANDHDLARHLLAAYGRLRTEPCCSAAPHLGPFNRR